MNKPLAHPWTVFYHSPGITETLTADSIDHITERYKKTLEAGVNLYSGTADPAKRLFHIKGEICFREGPFLQCQDGK